MSQRGILVGSDKNGEALLEFWWKNYTLNFSYPVAFVDFGLSESGKKWCKERGELIPFEKDISSIVEATAPKNSLIEKFFGKNYKTHRQSWLKKPFACLMTPFKETVWIDTDCLIQKPLLQIFYSLSKTCDIALVPEPEDVQLQSKLLKHIHKDEILYNSGVIVFRKECEVISAWAEILIEGKEAFPGDQDALSRVIYRNKFAVGELSPLYNWPWYAPLNRSAFIIHFMGDRGKKALHSIAA